MSPRDVLIWLLLRGPIDRLYIMVTEDKEIDFVRFRGQVIAFSGEEAAAVHLRPVRVVASSEPVLCTFEELDAGRAEARQLAAGIAADRILERMESDGQTP